ncbi:MAG TPA: putative Ig domain-containing protein [Steroidobacteraceae bacterium]|nr:putative Ig domain-containing protein [Steroidobacteraceae bacterium]
MYTTRVPVSFACMALFAALALGSTAYAAPPTISGAPPTSVIVGSSYSFTPTASDPDTRAKRLRFSIRQRPAWAQFSSATGTLYGTPQSPGTWSGIVISVSDRHSSASLPAFSITATEQNSAPTIGGTPSASALVNEAYHFTPEASDPDGDALTFSAQNLPAWLAFSSNDGSLSGTPTAADVGTYSNLEISVSDGSHKTTLPVFAITVNEVSNGVATLNWIPPTANTDGSQLTDLSGYRIFYGKSPDDLGTVISLNDAGLTSYVIDGLGTGTYYFAITALSSAGAESEKSEIASKTLN